MEKPTRIHDCQHIRVDYVFQYHVLHLMCDVFSYRFGSVLLALFCNEPLLILFYFYSIGSFFFTCALVKDLKNDIESYNKILCNKKIPESEKLAQLCERIRFSYLKRWVVMIDECWNYENRVFGRRFTISHFLSPFAPSPLHPSPDYSINLLNFIKPHWRSSFWDAPELYVLQCLWLNSKSFTYSNNLLSFSISFFDPQFIECFFFEI